VLSKRLPAGTTSADMKMDPDGSSEDEIGKKEYLFVVGADRSYTAKIRAHVLRKHMRKRQRHARNQKLASSAPKPLVEEGEWVDEEINASVPGGKFAAFCDFFAIFYLMQSANLSLS
jgi:hypothetical protein